jgi:hypothetical protein
MIAALALLVTSSIFAWWAVQGVRKGRIHTEGFTSEKTRSPTVFWVSIGFYAVMSAIGLIGGVAAALAALQ